MLRILGALLLLASFAFAGAAPAQTRLAAPLPAAQGANEKSLAAKAQAALDPNPAVAYFNICATLYNIGETVKTIAACDKAIAADPKKADAYFVKGSVRVGQGAVGKNGKYTVPSGTVETLKQYLVLAPGGGHAKEVQEMLDLLK